MNTPQPSDKLIKKIFSKRQEAIDYFKENLPQNLVKSLDLENIQFGKENFVGLEWDESRTDQLYRIPLKQGSHIYIYLLFEHKSYYDSKIYLQLLEYLSKIYHWQIENEKELKVILPFVFYHGEENWDLGFSFQEMFSMDIIPKEFHKYIPKFQIQLFELKKTGEEFKSKNIVLNLLIRLIQIIREEPDRFEIQLIQLFTLLSKEKEESKRIEILLDMIKYIFSTRKDAERYNRKEIFKSLETEYMTLLEKLEEKGQIEGKIQGKIEGKIETARKMKEKGFSLSEIKDITGFTEGQLRENGIL
jgi:predicted transposase/invertase (TIGR01784 family)